MALIRGYRAFISPYKGFSCAHRLLAGGDSCSAYGYRVIARFGLATGWPLLRRRMRACGDLHRQHRARQGQLAGPRPVPRSAMLGRSQAGDCDCDLPCDVDVSDCLSCDGGDCDFKRLRQWWRRQRGKADEAAPADEAPVRPHRRSRS